MDQEVDALTEFETIPPYRRQPLRFSRWLAVFCYALSFAAHAVMMVWLVTTPVQPASPWAGRSGDMPDGERRPVAVTLTMRMSDLAQPGQSRPSERSAEPSDTPPTGRTADKPDKAPADAAPNDRPPREHEHDRPEPNTERQTADTEATPPPGNEPATDSVQTASNTPDPAEQGPAPDASASAPSDSAPPPAQATAIDSATLAQQARVMIDEVLPAVAEFVQQVRPPTADPSLPQTTESTTVPAPDDPAETSASADAALALDQPPGDELPDPPDSEQRTAEPTTETSTAADQALASQDRPQPEPKTSTETDAAALPSEPTAAMPEVERAEDDQPPAVVHDEASVDQPLAFKSKVRPSPSAVSRRLGETGTIAIRVEVDTDGSLLDYTVLDDAGKPRLLAAALEALEASTFSPAEHEGRAVRSTRVIEYRF